MNTFTLASPRHSLKRTYPALSKRKTTEEWLEGVIKEQNIKFRYFLTLSFNKAQSSTLNQYLDNRHIKNVLLDFFYPNKKPNNRIRFWFFVEKHISGQLHVHILMEGMNGITWLEKNNRRITIRKSTLLDIVSRDFSMDDVITEALTNHLQAYIKRLGRGKQSVDFRSIGNVQQRVQYVNKSLNSLDFNNWEHIDFQNSDL
jgi:hypothetical protein